MIRLLEMIWIAIFLLTCITDIESVLCGKGINLIDGEFYRFVTAGLVHTHPVHVLGNVYLMHWLADKYEETIGSFRFLTIGFIGAVFTQIVFCSIFRNTAVSIGGSGYWYALVGFILILQFRVPEFPVIGRKWMLIYLAVFNIPFLAAMNWTTLVFHSIAFGFGAAACVICGEIIT